ncbi:autophagy-related protein 18a-like [Aegilops tauschii subsp. strangulata]|uniref:WD repeat domain phosphoinositide-interacting protein 3 n=1 Tax=Aegilops tauschii TaxID=37682 RepID=N1QWK7_AEGTA
MVSSSSSPAASAEADSPIVHVAFSSGASHFVASTATGFHVFSCDESVERVRYKSIADVSDGAEVTSAEMLTWSRLAVVTRETGGAEHEAIYFFDESKKAIRISSDKTPGLEDGDAGRQGHIKNSELVATGPNPLGLCALAVDRRAATFMYALPRPEKGAVQVCRSGQLGSVDVRAHASSLSCIALSRDGRLLATAGSKGTLVRIFSTDDGTMVQELRRGIDRADIHCVAFSLESQWLAVSSDKGTVHVFPVASVNKATEGGGDDSDNMPVTPPAAAAAPATAKQGSSLSFLKGYLPSYFSSEWSLAQVRLREGVDYTVEFWRHHPNTILIAGTDGSFYRCRFDPVNAGEMKELEHERFIKKIKE